MARRKTTTRPCGHEGCKEYGLFDYDNLKELQSISRRQWFCTRHSDVDKVLSLTNRTRETIYTLSKVYSEAFQQESPGLYWVSPDDGVKSGFIYGPGFKAFQEDFPEGTKITVRVELTLPDEN